MNTLRSIVYLIIAIAVTLPATARNDRFYRSACKKVWGMNRPEFDPKADLSDSIFDGCGAAIIAEYIRIEASRVAEENILKKNTLGISMTEATEATRIHRVMVKINDDKALENYTSFEYLHGDKIEQSNYIFCQIDNTFGARIHHPDGTIVEVDTNEAFDLTKGKKDKKTGKRIAIPGLAVGDVLEYFYYSRTYIDELHLLPETVNFTDIYPIRRFTLECDFDRELTIEYASYNGAPLLPGNYDTFGRVLLGVSIENTPGYNKPRFFNELRQSPYIKIFMINNKARLAYKPMGSRSGGIYPNPSAKQIMSDLAYRLRDFEIPTARTGDIASTVKKWMKKHPDASENEIADAAWLVSLHHAINDPNETYDTKKLSALFADVMNCLALKSPVFIGATSLNTSSPVIHKTRFTEPECFVRVGSRDYYFSSTPAYAPGEIPALIQGENAFMFPGKRSALTSGYLDLITMPVTTPRDNKTNCNIALAINPDDITTSTAHMHFVHTGSEKFYGELFNEMSDITTEAERFLDLPASKRAKVNVDSVASRERLTKLMNVAVDINGIRPANDITDPRIICKGLLPGEKFEYEFDATFEGITNHAGKDLIVNVGSIISSGGNIPDDERTRDVDIYLGAPVNRRTDLKIEVPDGYAVDPASLENIRMNINNEAGSLFASAKLSDDGRTLTISINRRNPHYVLPADKWPEFLELSDAEDDFTRATIVLNRL